MFFSSIIKAIPFLLQVLLVVAAVAVFAFFDPFGIFIQTRQKLKDTPVDVRSIREIGELITAEYYGEVIGSYAHEVEQRQDTSRQIFYQVMLDLTAYYTQEINELYEQYDAGELKRRDIYEAFTSAFKGVNNTPEFENLLYFIANRDKFKSRNLDDRLKLGKKKSLIRNAVKSGYDDQASINNAEAYLKPLFDAYEQTLKKERKKRLKKKNLVMLGRGWVKAGFDFGSFTDQNFKYDAKYQNIYFIGFQPKILSATINPWFIPEEGVEGFEFLVVERKSRRDYKVVQKVKQRCLDELVRKAHEREIMVKAIENAEESLKEFFSLLIDEEINQVIFYNNEFEYVYDEIIKNDTITGEELLLVDHMLQKNSLGEMSPEEFYIAKSIFIDSIYHSKAVLYPFDKELNKQDLSSSILAYAVCRDGNLDEIQDGNVITNYTARYCDLAKDMHNFKHSCSSVESLKSTIAAQANIFIARKPESIAYMSQYIAPADLDSLFDNQEQFVGLQIGAGNEMAVKKLIDALIDDACASCEVALQ